ncbi:hypothetical protein [aff. Roholtiella sp. LEGE 12411]|uniref:hypothetical protein n=1 Tax=aff. Roholtiella sp. LEGE 12411 TaxID=1828822 RepID=UPI001880EC76|nr:hypothetical protein [aff. Roholtiella sp. LEGE 12411]MBE9036033.1 hypothetical protein [aff. Roholtiella sp. LEGE 12411]
MSNLPVFQLLLQDNPNLFSTEGLSSLLQDCLRLRYPKRHKFIYPSLLDRQVYLALAGLGNGDAEDEEIVHRIMADPKGWCLDADDEVHEGAKFYDKMGKMFGSNFGADLFIYHSIRDNIQELQQRLGISGVKTKNISVRDRLFSYPTVDDQLITLESDRIILKQAVPEIIKYFVSLVQMQPAYELSLVSEDEQKIPTSVATVEGYAPMTFSADIYAESCSWEKSGDNCWQGKSTFRKDPDKIRLFLHLDHNDQEFICFEAVHPDKNRFPWLVETAD